MSCGAEEDRPVTCPVVERRRELTSYVRPPIGTTKEQVEKVFGRPIKIAPYGRYGRPLHQYALFPGNDKSEVFLCIDYRDERVSYWQIAGLDFYQNRGIVRCVEGSETYRRQQEELRQLVKMENENACAVLKAVKAKNAALKNAQWNQKQ